MQKIMKQYQKATRYLICVALICLVAVFVTGCASATEPDAVVQSEDTQMIETIIEETFTSESEEILTTETNVVEETYLEETMEEWLADLGSQGICLAVWNESNSTKRLMVEGEEYVKGDGDRIFACAPSLISKLNISSNEGTRLSRLSENCVEILYDDSDEDNKVATTILCGDGEEFTINFVIMAGETSTSSFTSESEVSGYEWAESLDYDYAKMVVWNDTTGTRLELEEGATYQLCEGDEVAIYMPENYLFDFANVDQTFIDRGINTVTLKWKEIDLGEKV